MTKRTIQISAAAGILAFSVCAALGRTSDVRTVKTVTVMHTGNADLPFKFNFKSSFVISFNLNIPQGNAVKDSLLARFVENSLAEQVVFQFFSPTDRLEFIGLKFGIRVPLNIAQAVIKAVSESSDKKITLALQTEDGDFGNTQRVYIGSLTQQCTNPITQGKLQSILDPRISLDEFHKICLENE
jgi:hypothetical protein